MTRGGSTPSLSATLYQGKTMNWYNKAVEELEKNLYSGLISYYEFKEYLRELNEEYKLAKEEQDIY